MGRQNSVENLLVLPNGVQPALKSPQGWGVDNFGHCHNLVCDGEVHLVSFQFGALAGWQVLRKGSGWLG